MKEPPKIENSTFIERKEYINLYYHCNGDCSDCGLCEQFGGKHPQAVFLDYINGKCSYETIVSKGILN